MLMFHVVQKCKSSYYANVSWKNPFIFKSQNTNKISDALPFANITFQLGLSQTAFCRKECHEPKGKQRMLKKGLKNHITKRKKRKHPLYLSFPQWEVLHGFTNQRKNMVSQKDFLLTGVPLQRQSHSFFQEKGLFQNKTR